MDDDYDNPAHDFVRWELEMLGHFRREIRRRLPSDTGPHDADDSPAD